jgi:hypothetical protein
MSASLEDLRSFYDRCQHHDWYCEYSDDYSVTKRGYVAFDKLNAEADTDPAKRAILTAWRAHMFSGKPWNTEKAPRPIRP